MGVILICSTFEGGAKKVEQVEQPANAPPRSTTTFLRGGGGGGGAGTGCCSTFAAPHR